MIKAVLFDLGGVYFEDGTKKFIHNLSKRVGITYEEIYPLFREGKSLEYRKNKLSGKVFFKWASDELGGQVSPEELNYMWVSQYTEIPGIRKIINELKAKGTKVTILSDNVPERIEYLQDKYKFLDLFDNVVLSYEVNLTKASPEIFELALSRIQVKPQESIFVDDREPNLIVAEKLGIKTILFTTVEDLKEKINNFTKDARKSKKPRTNRKR
jgi:epoxide hydrolase-like predicted phosphatase